jgi:predicted MarR family transcription regulator
MRIRKAMATGMAMTMNVHDTHAVLWAVRKRVDGMKYTGMGRARDRIAKRETVTGNPKDRGHLARTMC